MAAPGLASAQPTSQKLALYANVGADLTHYDVDVAGAELIRRSTVTLPAGVQYAWPHASRRYIYVATSSSAPGCGTAGTGAAIVCQTLDEFIVKLTEDGYPIDDAYLAAKTPWLQRQLHNPLGLGDRPFVVGRRPVAREELPTWQPDLMLDDTGPFRLSRNHFMIEQRHEAYHVRDLRSTLGTIVNGQPIGDHFCTDDVLLRARENEVIAGGAGSPFVFSVSIPGPLVSASRWTGKASSYSEGRRVTQ